MKYLKIILHNIYFFQSLHILTNILKDINHISYMPKTNIIQINEIYFSIYFIRKKPIAIDAIKQII
jgi:hypothetical protein